MCIDFADYHRVVKVSFSNQLTRLNNDGRTRLGHCVYIHIAIDMDLPRQLESKKRGYKIETSNYSYTLTI